MLLKYLQWKEGHCISAHKSYSYPIRHFLAWLKKDVSEIKQYDIQDYQARLAGRYSPATVAISLYAIKDYLKYCQRLGLCSLEVNLIRAPKVPEKQIIIYSENDFIKFQKLREDEFWHSAKKLAIYLLWDTGVRASELVSINISSLETTKQSCIITTKKNLLVGQISWSDTTHNLLIKYLGTRICLNQKDALFIGKGDNRGRDRLTTRSLERWVKKACEQAGVEYKGVHAFRHAKAHRMAENGARVDEIKTILRHKNPISSFKYLRYSETEQKKIAEKYL